jgi:hypothetical protein
MEAIRYPSLKLAILGPYRLSVRRRSAREPSLRDSKETVQMAATTTGAERQDKRPI